MFLEWKSTTYYIYIATALWITMSTIAITVLLIEIKTFYMFFYSDQETKLQEMQRMGSDSNISGSGSGSNHSNPLSRSGSSRSGSGKSKSSTFNMISIKNKLLHLIPIFAYSFYIPMGINSVLYTWNIGIFIGCTQYHISATCYAFAKLSVYFVFIYKLYTIYSDSIFNYNTKLLIILSIIAFICTFCNVIWNVLTTKGHSFNIDGNTYCGAIMSFPVLLSTVIFDTSISFLCCYLFIRPLWRLNKLDNTPNSAESQKMHHLITKYTNLTFIAVLSTFIILIFMGITKLTSAVAIDIIINCFCIMLFNKKYDHYYKILCCGAIKATSKIITICCKNR